MSNEDVVAEGQGWRALGRAVRRAREATPGFDDTPVWAEAVGRSTRQLLGLERGERVGPKTLRAVESALGWSEGRATDILNGYNVWVSPTGEIMEHRAALTHVFREGGQLIGEISDMGGPFEIIERGGWKEFSDARIAQLIEEAAVELQVRANGRTVAALNAGTTDNLDLAADRQAEAARGAQLRATQDAVGEEPQVEP